MIEELTNNYIGLEQDFQVLFPELMAYIDIWNFSRRDAEAQRRGGYERE